MTNIRRMFLMASASASAIALFGPLAAHAQTAAQPAPEAAATGQVQEVVVTASRVERQGYNAPSPTTVLGTKDVELRAPASVINLLNEVPSFRPSTTSLSRPAFQGSGPVSADLRGLGNRRTLTLVDKERFVPASANGTVDLNLIPTNMIERADVVTGGASAAYGSDAVSGVVNLITKHRIEGVEGEVSAGISQFNDDGKGHVALDAGGDFSDGRGHFAAGGEWYHEGIVTDQYARPWGQLETGTVLYPGTAAQRPAGQPSRLIVNHVRTPNQSTFGGMIENVNSTTNLAPGVTANIGATLNQEIYGNNATTAVQFGTGGTILPYNIGQVFGSSSINGGNYGETGGRLLSLSPEQDRYTFLGNFDYQLTPDITATAQINMGRSDTFFLTAGRRDFNTVSASTNPSVIVDKYILIKADNAYLPPSVAALMAPGTAFYMGRVGTDLGLSRAASSNEIDRIDLGLNGKFNFKGDWKWDVSLEAGRVFYNQHWADQSVDQRYQNSYDAVKNASGQIVCRVNQVTVTDPACVPFNVFGYNSATNMNAVRAYVEGNLLQQDTYDQQAAEANISGEPFSTWAGPVSVAAGIDWRKDSIVQQSDAISQVNGFDNQNPKSFKGSYATKEIYGETVIPLAKDLPFMKQWDFNGAVRRTDYTTSGAVTTWKVGTTYQVIDDLRFRGTVSQDIRAPNLIELYGTQTTVTSVNNPYTNVNTGSIQAYAVGNTSLQPERAKTVTAGVVVEPRFFPRFRASMDFWHVNIDGAIAQYTAQNIANNCKLEADAGKPGFFCSQLVTNGQYNTNLQIFSLRPQSFNLVRQTAEGIDFEASYSHPLLAGNLQMRYFATYLHDLTLYDVTSSTQYAGTIAYVFNGLGGAPHWQWTLNTDYSQGPATVSLQTRFVGAANIDPTLIGPDNPHYSPTLSNSINVNKIGNVWYFNLSGTYDIRRTDKTRLQAFIVVNNLFNLMPPWAAGGANVGEFYDSLGRTYQTGIRFKF